MRPMFRTMLAAALLGTWAAPSVSRADHGWREHDGHWFFYTDINQIAHWYYFDPNPGVWLYRNAESWMFVSSYRPPQVCVAERDLDRLPESFVSSPRFYTDPNQQSDPLDAEGGDANTGDADSGDADAGVGASQVRRRTGWARRRVLWRRR